MNKQKRAELTSCLMLIVFLSGALFVRADGPRPSAGQAERAAGDATEAVGQADAAGDRADAADAAAANQTYPDTDAGRAAAEADQKADAADAEARKAAGDAETARRDAENARDKANKDNNVANRDAAATAEQLAKEAEANAENREKEAAAADAAADKADAKASPFDNKKLKKKARDANRDRRAKLRKANAAVRFAQKCAELLDESSEKNKKKKEDMIRTLEGHRMSTRDMASLQQPGAGTIASLAAAGKLQVTISGTGETIGNVANFTFHNPSKEKVVFDFPPSVLLSVSGMKQPYVKFGNQTVTLDPGATTAVQAQGVCIDGHKPPVDSTDVGELVIAPSSPGRDRTIANVQQIATTAQQLQNTGKFTTPYSKDPKRELDIVVQWATWVHASADGPKPIGFDDFKKKILQQAGDITRAQKKELEKGAVQIWDAIKLVGREAKPI